MKLNRRNFIKSSSLIFSGLLLNTDELLSYTISDQAKDLRELRNSIGTFTKKGGTIGYYVDNDVLVVVDAQFPDTAKEFFGELKTKTNRNIDYLFNTHHHRDHTMGNYYLRQFTNDIIAHKNCPRLQHKQNDGTENESKVVTANITFDNEMYLTLPNEKITSSYLGVAHTSGDIVIHFENANVAHLGDLVFNNVYPYIDNTAECSVKSWIMVLDRVIKKFDSDTKFIFGHANKPENVVGTKEDVIRKRNYLEALYNYVEKLTNEGKTINEIANTNTIPGFDNIKELWDGARKMNLKATAEQVSKL